MKPVSLEEIWNFLAQELEEGRSTYPSFEFNLPPVVLHLLTSIQRGRLDSLIEFRPLWEQAQAMQRGVDKNSVPLEVGSQILAHHILHSTGKPVSVIRLAKAIFGQFWRNYERNVTVIEALEAILKVLRSPWADTQERLKAVETLGEALDQAGQWPHVENALYHQMFSWPLLVFAGHSAISLPVAIDICFDDKAKIEILGNDAINTDDWESSLWNAADAARVLWLGKHGNFKDFRREVQGASAIYDFSVADRIVSSFPEQISLMEDSMEAYFSQVILSRLLGNTAAISSIVTGSIGQRRREKGADLADFEFRWPQGVTKKLEYVYKARFFERFILPDLDDLSETDPQRGELAQFMETSKDEQSTELNYAKHLQHVADSFQIGGWRQFRYVRCPDIAWHIHPSGRKLPSPETEGVKACLAALKSSKNTILELQSEVTPIDLAAALWHINTTLREKLSPRTPPMVSWAFVRAIPEEQDSRFWHIVWKVTGATHQDFDDFHRTATPEAAARHLAEALNCFSPRQSCPSHRAPDILVILGTEHFSANLEKVKNPLLRCHAFAPVVEYLGRPGFLQAIPDAQMRESLGNTRLIVFPADTSPKNVESGPEFSLGQIEDGLLDGLSLLRLGETEQELLQCLSVFRFGFTQQMASLLWKNSGYDGLPVRNLLEEFVRRGYLRYGFGEYHLPGKVGQTWTPSGDRADDAKRHFAAGVAMAPYLSLSTVPGLAFDEAFHPTHVHEAHYHLHKAFDLLDKNPNNPQRNTVRTALNRLQRFAELPGWNMVNQLLKSRNSEKDAYEVAMDLLEARKNSEAPPHPVHLLNAVRAAEQWWDMLRRYENYKNLQEVSRLLLQIEELFGEAERACEHPMFRSERNYNRLKFLTQRAVFLEKYGQVTPQSGLQEKIKQRTEEALKMIEEGADGSAAFGGWYESTGDNLERHVDAEKVYELGVRWVPDWHQLWIKLIGCARLAYSNHDKAKAICETLPVAKLDLILQKSLPGISRDKKHYREWVQQRWIAGIKQFREMYETDPLIGRHFDYYARELER
jgi:hypothetical protein